MSHNDAYADPAIATKQRTTVDCQLIAMHAGRVPLLFQVAGEFLQQLHDTSRLPRVTLLDAGCGSAYYSEVFEYHVPGWIEYTGVDYNPGMVALANKKYPKLSVTQRNLRALEFPDTHFDIVFSGACIAHIKEWREALSELIRVTGKWLILHRNPVWQNDTELAIRHDYDTDVWVYRFNERELLSVPINAKFDLILTRDVSGVVDGKVTRSYLFQRR